MLNACTKELQLPNTGTGRKIALSGELIAGDTVSIRGGLSIAVSLGSSMMYQLPSNLSIQLSTASSSYSLQSTADDYTNLLKTLSFHSTQKLSAETIYHLTATEDVAGIATSDITVPPAFLATIVDTATVTVSNFDLLRVRIQIFDDPDVQNYYSFESAKEFIQVDGYFTYQSLMYRISNSRSLYDSLVAANVPMTVVKDTTKPKDLQRVNVYTDDEKTENFKLNNAQSASKRILLSDSSFNGTVYTTVVYLDKQYFTSEDYLSKGIILLRIRSIAKDYFNYLKQYELFESQGSLGTIAQPVEIRSNINNGVGVIGGVYQLQISYGFDTWDN